MLRLENITKDFSIDKDQITHVLKGITIQFRSCEFVSILGHSGCGKTTLLNIVGGLDKCTSGGVYLDGASTKTFTEADWNDFRNRQIGFVFQSYNLIPHQTVLRNVEMPLILSEIPEEERRRRALAALEKVGLADHAKKKPMQMSGGQMQRVAIARALVNNPSIILADEPTGALDSESGIQIMDILKEISKERLVVMVTHNDVLADKYSTRIIKMQDGQVVDDSNPYSLEECLAEEEINRRKWEEEEGIFRDEEQKASETHSEGTAEKVKGAVKKNVKKLTSAFKRKGNTHMSFGTAVRLSWSNLNSKKARSLLTSLAGSIGIIGIMLVLCLSNGVRTYINSIEENALSVYPMTVSQTNTMDLNAMISVMMTGSEDKEKYPNNDVITPKNVIGNAMSAILNSFSENDLEAFKKHIEENFNNNDGYVKYDYGVDFSVFCNYVNDTKYMQVDPFLEGMTSLVESSPALKGAADSLFTMLGGKDGVMKMMSVWEQLPDNTQLLTSQYDLIGNGSRWPTAWNEAVLIVDAQNQVYDFSLFALGLAGENEVINSIMNSKNFLAKEFTVDELLKLEYKVMTNSDYYEKVLDENGNWTGEWDDRAAATSGGYEYRRQIDFVDSHSETVKVVGVIRPKQGVSITCMNGLVGYSSKLQEHLSAKAQNSDIYKAQMESDKAIVNYYDADLKGENASLDEKDKTAIATHLGVADFTTPTKVYIYANSFEGKDNIDAFINQYNADTGANIKYSDMLGIITGYVDTLTETVTYVLVGFAAISLVVSSIMIAIIIYTSVLERRKEIGVLRSIGARKKDISNVFISESGILGVISGLIGILIAYIFSLLANAILLAVLDIPDLATLAWWHPVMMILISIALSILAGFVPARIASNKDPVECLRSE